MSVEERLRQQGVKVNGTLDIRAGGAVYGGTGLPGGFLRINSHRQDCPRAFTPAAD